jgi:RNA polymerase sigma-70 factor (ECF subfamily)
MDRVIETMACEQTKPLFRHDRSTGRNQDREVPPMETSRAQQDLLANAIEGSVQAFAELIRPYRQNLYVVSLAIGGSRERAEELLLEAECRAFSARNDLVSLEHLSYWLLQLTIHTGLALVGLEPDSRGADLGIGDLFTGLTRLDANNREIRNGVPTALLTLPQLERVVIVLRDTLNLGSSEISKILSIPIVTVREKLSHGRFRMLKMLMSVQVSHQRAQYSA